MVFQKRDFGYIDGEYVVCVEVSAVERKEQLSKPVMIGLAQAVKNRM